MRFLAAARILADRWTSSSLKEKYWGLRASASRFRQLLGSRNRHFRRVVFRDLRRFLFHANRPVRGETRKRADAALQWLLRGQDATPDGGVSLGYFPCSGGEYDGWRASYPETTGYIIQSLAQYARQYEQPDVLARARTMADWEASVQMESGAVQGGPVCPPDQQRAAVFNTGMVLQGLTAVLGDGVSDEVGTAARRAADWLVGDLGDDGHFRTHGPFVSQDRIKTYNCLCAWALYRYGNHSGEDVYKHAAVRSVEAALREQQENGWIQWNCLTRPKAPLLHTIGYALQGILEVGILADRDDFVMAARRGAMPLVDRVDSHGFLHGRFYSDWEPACFSSCLTGNAQLAVVLYRLGEHAGDPRLREVADRLTDFLKGVQVLDSPNEALNGAIAGSYPIVGDYMTYGYPNWATKYFLDALMFQDRPASA